MTILADHQIQACADRGMIHPFVPNQQGRVEGKISYGLSSYGYDARLAPVFKMFRAPGPLTFGTVIDPKNFDSNVLVTIEAETLVIPPHGFALGMTVERFSIPRDVIATCMGKSTYARIGLLINVTPLEPQWIGKVTLEMSNTTSFPVRVYANEGICQFRFNRPEEVCEVSYEDRQGKYQDQHEVTHARM
jgi:dCTP deaminase